MQLDVQGAMVKQCEECFEFVGSNSVTELAVPLLEAALASLTFGGCGVS